MKSTRSLLPGLPLAVVSLVGLAVLGACSSEGTSTTTDPNPATASDAPPPPAAKCAANASAPLPADGWFTDITADVGLSDVEAVRVSSADIDGDGFPDLVLHTMGSKRDTAEAPSKRVFLNRAGARFEEITKDSGLLDSRDGPGTGRLSHFSVFADVDNDGDLDLFDGAYIDANTDAVAAKGDRAELFLNDGKGHFTMAPRSAPSKLALPMAGGSFADYDRDGLVDLFVGTFYANGTSEGAGNRLFQGRGDGTFGDVSTASKVLRPSMTDNSVYLKGDNRKPAYGVTACDVDDDGDADLIVSAYGRSYNELWRNDNGVFTEVGYGTPFAADDDVDFKSDNEFYHCWCSEHTTQCTVEDAKPKVQCDRYSWTPGFDDQPARNAGNTFTTACADLDNDGDLDFIHATIRHWHIGQSADPSQIVRNDLAGGKLSFTRIANDDKSLARKHDIPDWNDGDMDVGAFDADNDGKKDIWLSSSDYPDTWGSLFHQESDGTFTNATKASGIRHYHAHGFAAVDIDNDGDLDLVVATSLARCSGDKDCPPKGTVKVYRNNIGSSRNWVKLRLHGKGEGFSNAAAIGAKVTVVSGGVRQVQEVGGGYGHFGLQHDTTLTFGTGATCAIDSIEVRWPNSEGTVQKFANVPNGHVVEITEGDAAPKYDAALPVTK